MFVKENETAQSQRNVKNALTIGLLLPTWTGGLAGETPSWKSLLALVQHAETIGFDSIWIADDLLYKFDNGEKIGLWECWSMLSALAAATTHITLGSLVSCNNYRHPALLTKIADTVNEISGGRLVLGLGTGGDEGQHHTFGFPWKHRSNRFEEALAIIHSLLRTGYVDFHGEYYQVQACELAPQGSHSRSIPILIGTENPGPRMLSLVARYADIWNGLQAFEKSSPALIPSVRNALDRACQEQQRDPDTLARTVTIGVSLLPPGHPIRFGAWDMTGGTLTGSPEELVEIFLAFAQEGISQLQISLTPCTRAGIDAFVPTLSLLKKSMG